MLNRFLFIIISFFLPYLCERAGIENAPSLQSRNGHLYFKTPSFKSIYFKTVNGHIYINDIDFELLCKEMTLLKTRVDHLQTLKSCNCELISNKINTNIQQIAKLKKTNKNNRRRLRQLTVTVNNLQRTIETDECADNPCQNSGVCIDKYNGYQCLCKSNFQGQNCEEDVNECEQLAHTDLGCQNNARCENFRGGYRCVCSGKWTGTHCSVVKNGCTGSSNAELCGHGICMPDTSSQTSKSHQCLCDVGWKKDPVTGTCTVDEDECNAEGKSYPCSTNPHVSCINTPGGFRCNACPPGFSGNGYKCVDINECGRDNNVCQPEEQCVNTFGSYNCQCRPGTTRNSANQCISLNKCNENNGGCSSRATCVPNVNSFAGRTCICPSGYVGNGVGHHGCIRRSTRNRRYRYCVRRKLCRNGGTCVPLRRNRFRCQCRTGFTGRRCRTVIRNPCSARSNPCQNGGTCIVVERNRYRCECRLNFGGRNCQIQHSSCGNNILFLRSEQEIKIVRDPIISSSLQYYKYPCKWTMAVNDDQFIEVKPLWISLQGSCSRENLTLTEILPFSQTEIPLKVLCSSSSSSASTQSFNTTGSVLIIRLTLENTYSLKHGFILKVKPRRMLSGGDHCCQCKNRKHFFTTNLTGIFQSMNYPFRYPTNFHCSASFEAPAGSRKKVILRILTMDLGDRIRNSCSNESDHLEIVSFSHAPEIINACNQDQYQNTWKVYSEFNVMFKSDDHRDNDNARFKLQWRVSSQEAPCGSVLSVNTPQPMLIPAIDSYNFETCSWKIKVYNSTRLIKFDIDETGWSTEQKKYSIYRIVEEVGKNSEEENILLINQGDHLVSSPIQVTSDVNFKFYKLRGSATPSVRATFEILCGSDVNMDIYSTFTIESDNYPNQYGNNLNCIYIFRAETRNIAVHIDNFDVKDELPCNHDYISIQGSDSKELDTKFCNGNREKLFTLMKLAGPSPLKIEFRSGSSPGGRGFRLRVKVLDCGGYYQVNSGYKIINFPSSLANDNVIQNGRIRYKNRQNCVWNIKSEPGKHFIVLFKHFHLEKHSKCIFDYVRVTSGNDVNVTFCGNKAHNVFTQTNEVKIEFRSDSSVLREGFTAVIFPNYNAKRCYQRFTESSGQFSGPTTDYNGWIFCVYEFEVPIGRKIIFKISISHPELDNDGPTSCKSNDRLVISSGGIRGSSIGVVCPASPPTSELMTYYNKGTILHLSSSKPNSQKFNFTVTYTSVEGTCGGISTGKRFYLTSPNYPMYPLADVDCEWEVRAQTSELIMIKINRLLDGRMSYSNNCSSLYRPILTFTTSKQRIVIHCRSQLSKIYTFTEGSLWIKFLSKYSNRRNFRLTVRLSCKNVILTNVYGRIDWPTLPNPFACKWIITGLRGSKITVYIDKYDPPQSTVSNSSSCYTKLLIADKAGTILDAPCNRPLTRMRYNSTKIPIIVYYYITKYLSHSLARGHEGLSLEYEVEGCLKTITHQNPNYRIVNPLYPEGDTAVDCVWNFEGSPGQSVSLTIDTVETDNDVNCTDPILSGFEDNASVMNICVPLGANKASPYKFQSSTHKFSLFFYSHKTGSHPRKFRATYSFVESKCEKEITTTHGVIQSPNYPQKYPNNLQCHWNISVRQSNSVHFKFLDLRLEKHQTCQYDSVSLYSKVKSQLYPMGYFCGANEDVLNKTFISYSNSMKINFKTDSSSANSGFKATYSEGCGGLRMASVNKENLFSPSFPYQYHLNDGICEWTIVGNTSNLGEKIFFYFLGFEVGSSNEAAANVINCTDSGNSQIPLESLTIFDGMHSDSAVIARFCQQAHLSRPIVSSGPYLRLLLKSRTGTVIFKATYSTGRSNCGGNLYHLTGRFMNPSYPSATMDDLDCTWIVNASVGSRITLIPKVFSRVHMYLLFDYVEIRSIERTGTKLVGRYYTKQSLLNVTTDHYFNSSLRIRFRSQGGRNSNRVKYLMEYYIDYPDAYTEVQGQFASPQYGHMYPYNARQTWVINPSDSSDLLTEIKFISFNVGKKIIGDTIDDYSCSGGYVLISDSNGLVKRLCGAHLPPPTKYKHPITIELNGEGGRYPGFLLEWTKQRNETVMSLPGKCHFLLGAQNTSQILQSPGFPGMDKNNRNCQWRIFPKNRGIMQVKMLNFSMEPSSNCKYENLTLRIIYTKKVINNWRRVIRRVYCGKNISVFDFLPSLYIYSININYKVDKYDIFPGFQLEYKLRCFSRKGVKVKDEITSPNYPNPIREDTNCIYSYYLYNLLFLFNMVDIDLPPAVNGVCEQAYVEINTNRKSVSKRYCGSDIPRELTNKSMNIYILYLKFKGNFSANSNYRGFKFTLQNKKFDQCGYRYQLKNVNDTLTIDGSSDKNDTRECDWRIISSMGTKIVVEVDATRLNCQRDFFNLYDGATELAPKLNRMKLCRSKKKYMTTSNHLLMILTKIQVKSIYSVRISVASCGGDLKAKSGVIVSSQYLTVPTNCTWRISNELHWLKEVKFKISIPIVPCSEQNITIYKGENDQETVWTNCNNTQLYTRNTFYTVYTRILIVSQQVKEVNGKYFTFEYRFNKTKCSHDYHLPSGTIKSLNYPSMMPPYIPCQWKIIVDIDRNIELNIRNYETKYQNCIYISHLVINYRKRICGPHRDFKLVTNTSRLKIWMMSAQNQRLWITYSSEKPAKCGFVVNAESSKSGTLARADIRECPMKFINYRGNYGTLNLVFGSKKELEKICKYSVFRVMTSLDKLSFYSGNILLDICRTKITNFMSPLKEVYIIYSSYYKSNISISYHFSECGGMREEMSGTVMSPGYPNKYERSSKCQWILRTPSISLYIKLVIVNLDLEKHSDCKFDRLAVRIGDRYNSPIFHQFCGRHNHTNETLYFHTNRLTLDFFSDFSVQRNGFLLLYSFYDQGGSCVGISHNVSGAIMSPNYPQPYPSFLSCNWTIVVQDGYRIKLTFEEPFDIEVHAECLYDYLEIIDSNYTKIKHLCGYRVPTSPIISTGRRVSILFTTDVNSNHDGFKLRYTSDCGGIITDRKGIIKTPLPILQSWYRTKCEYKIPAQPNTMLYITVTTNYKRCRHYYSRYLEIWQKTPYGRYELYKKICHPTKLELYNSMGFLLKYNTTIYSKWDDFIVTYLFEKNVKVLKNVTGRREIGTPLFPSPYVHHINLTWIVTIPQNYIFYIQFKQMDIEFHSTCNFDYVAIYVNQSNPQKFCGKMVYQSPLKFNVSSLKIKFVSDRSHTQNHTGFKALIFSSPGPSLGCGGDIYLNASSTGTISSPDIDNDGRYDVNLYCEWTLSAPPGFGIRIKLENNSVAMEKKSANICVFDRLSFHNGFSKESPLIKSVCGKEAVDPITSAGNSLYILFRTDSSVTGKKFRMTYSVVQSTRHHVVNVRKNFQTLSVFNHPASKHILIDFNAANETDHMEIIVEVSMRDSDNCTFNRVVIQDTTLTRQNRIKVLCSSTTYPVTFITTGNTASAAIYISEFDSSHYQFKFRLYQCNRTEYGFSGSVANIERYRFDIYNNNQSCELTLIAPITGLRFQFYFKEFHIESSANCKYDYLQFIYVDENGNENKLPKMCGYSLPPSMTSNTSTVKIRFVTDRSMTKEGFFITYVVSPERSKPCGGIITESYGTITSPGFGTNEYKAGECSWIIRLSNKRIRESMKLYLMFTDLQLGETTSSSQCVSDTDYVEVKARRTRKVCTEKKPPIFTSWTNRDITIFYKSLNGGIGVGFRLEWSLRHL